MLAGLLGAVVIGGFSFVTVSLLPKPTQGDRLAIRLLDVLRERRGNGSVLTLAGQRLHVRCAPIGRRGQLVTMGDGTSFVLQGSHVVGRREASSPLADMQIGVGALTAAEADLAGSYALYAAEVVAQLEQGAKFDSARFGRPSDHAVAIALREREPRVELVVAEHSLRPLAATFRSWRIQAVARFVPSTGKGAGC
jgi:hypothetical protein